MLRTGVRGGGVDGCLGTSGRLSCLLGGAWPRVLILAATLTWASRGGASDDTAIVIVAALVVVGQAVSNSPFKRASSVLVDLSAIVHFAVNTGTNL